MLISLLYSRTYTKLRKNVLDEFNVLMIFQFPHTHTHIACPQDFSLIQICQEGIYLFIFNIKKKGNVIDNKQWIWVENQG